MSNNHNENCHSHQESCCNTPTPTLESIEHLADFFKVFADKTRVRILYLLKESELCVCCIAEELGMTSPAVSHQLRILKNNRLIKSRRDGKEVFYSLNDHHIHHILGDGMVHINEIYPEKQTKSLPL